MKRYFDLKDFITFLNLLEIGKTTSLYVENVTYEEEVEGDIEECKFQKINFCGDDIILYDTLRGSFGLIQDTPVAPWEDYAEGVYEDLVHEGEYKVFIEDFTEEKKSFRENLIERIGNRSSNPESKYYKILEIVLMEEDPKDISSKSGAVKPTAHFPIQKDTCSIVENANAVGLCFDRKFFLMSCIGKERIDSLNRNYKKVQKTLDDIESVLGKVPVVEKLRDKFKEYQIAINKFFDYTNEK